VNLRAKAHQTVRRQRTDLQHKTALTLIREHDTISHADLQVRNMVQNHRLAKSIQDAGWSAFLAVLGYKAACAGREVIAVNPAFTSQACSGLAWWSTRGCPSAGALVQSVGRACSGGATPPETFTGAGSAFGDSRGCLRG
jgi:IS605 OrfB family transposase